ncbi:MAG: hypothetical protein A2048_07660 [Deltaproteobacteria bacterium GWA2_45_12]|nr:MAG: hypothetical protein A2048_07660 [Deltaproteobacteria bacterium GWA2_45_12]
MGSVKTEQVHTPSACTQPEEALIELRYPLVKTTQDIPEAVFKMKETYPNIQARDVCTLGNKYFFSPNGNPIAEKKPDSLEAMSSDQIMGMSALDYDHYFQKHQETKLKGEVEYLMAVCKPRMDYSLKDYGTALPEVLQASFLPFMSDPNVVFSWDYMIRIGESLVPMIVLYKLTSKLGQPKTPGESLGFNYKGMTGGFILNIVIDRSLMYADVPDAARQVLGPAITIAAYEVAASPLMGRYRLAPMNYGAIPKWYLGLKTSSALLDKLGGYLPEGHQVLQAGSLSNDVGSVVLTGTVFYYFDRTLSKHFPEVLARLEATGAAPQVAGAAARGVTAVGGQGLSLGAKGIFYGVKIVKGVSVVSLGDALGGMGIDLYIMADKDPDVRLLKFAFDQMPPQEDYPDTLEFLFPTAIKAGEARAYQDDQDYGNKVTKAAQNLVNESKKFTELMEGILLDQAMIHVAKEGVLDERRLKGFLAEYYKKYGDNLAGQYDRLKKTGHRVWSGVSLTELIDEKGQFNFHDMKIYLINLAARRKEVVEKEFNKRCEKLGLMELKNGRLEIVKMEDIPKDPNPEKEARLKAYRKDFLLGGAFGRYRNQIDGYAKLIEVLHNSDKTPTLQDKQLIALLLKTIHSQGV